MKKDDYETRGRPRGAKYERICSSIFEAIEAAQFHNRPRGYVITVETGPVIGQINCSTSFKELREELAGKGLSITAYNQRGDQVFRIRKQR